MTSEKAAPALLSQVERTATCPGREQVEQDPRPRSAAPPWECEGPLLPASQGGAGQRAEPQEERTLSVALSLNTDDLICCNGDFFFESIKSIILLALDLKKGCVSVSEI